MNSLYAQDETLFNMLKVYDRHGTVYDLEVIVHPVDRQIAECNNTGGTFNFQLAYEDYGTGTGFYDPVNGQAARQVVCQVMTDLSHYIVAKTGKCSDQIPTLRILIKTSSFSPLTSPPELNFLGEGSPYYYNHASADQSTPSWAHDNVWRTLNGGEDNTVLPPYAFSGEDSYHGFMQFNLDPSLNWNFNLNTPLTQNNDDINFGPIRLEFYQCVLRAALQMLGIHSFMQSDGSSNITNNATNQPGLYTRFDSYLTDANGLYLLTYDACFQAQPDPTAIFNMQTPCTGVFFNANSNTTPIYTPSTWQPEISLNYLGDADPTNCGAYVLSKRMTGPVIRVPTDAEARILCQLGYEIDGTYGVMPTTPAITYSCSENNAGAGVDDGGALCATFIFSCLSDASISVSELLENDWNVTGISCVQGISENVTVNLSGSNVVISSANPGWNVFSYLPHNTSAIPGNPTFVYFQLGYCGNCTAEYLEPCNLVCNPALSQPVPACEPFAQPSGSFTPFLNLCTQFPGWASIGSAFWFADWTGGTFIPTPGGLNPIGSDPTLSMLGFRSAFTQPACNPNSFSGTALQTEISLAPGNYLFSFHYASDKNIDITQIPECEQLAEIQVALTTDAWINGMSTILSPATWWANCRQLSNDPAEMSEIFSDANVETEWRQGVACFSTENTYNRLLIYGITPNIDNCGIQALIDRVDIIPDIFPLENNQITAECNLPTLIGDPNICTEQVPYLAYQWYRSFNCNNVWTLIPGATATTYTAPANEHTGCHCYRLDRFFIDNFLPSPPTSQSGCFNRTANYTVCTDCCLQPPSSDFSVPAALCLFDQPWNLNPDDPNGSWTGTGTVQNDQFDPAQGPGDFELIYTVNNNPECPESTTTATITIDPECCLDNLNYTVTPNSNVPQITQVDGRTAYVVSSPLGTPIVNWNDNNNPFMLPPFNLNGSDPILFTVDVVVPAGITLNITDMQLFFIGKNRILVQRGAILNITDDYDGTPTLLKGLCNTVWQGIQVEGPGMGIERNTSPLDPVIVSSNFGEVRVSGNVRIEDAIFGIVAMSLPFMDTDNVIADLSVFPNPLIPQNSGIPNVTFFYAALYNYFLATSAISTTGGAVKINTGTTFFNCFEGINMSLYKGNPCNFGSGCYSYIIGAEFYSNVLPFPFNTHLQTQNTEAGIHLVNYEHLNILNNNFHHLKYGTRGVHVTNINFFNNNIQNIKAGVSIGNSALSPIGQNIRIVQNNFDWCEIPIQCGAAHVLIQNNAINQNTPVSLPVLQWSRVGIFLMGGTALVTDNQVYRAYRGAALLSCDLPNNFIRKNRFESVLTGVMLYGNNIGVQLECNDFYRYGLSIAAGDYTINSILQEAGVVFDQGDCDPSTPIGMPSDNRFYPTSIYANSLFSSINSPTSVFNYYYRNETAHIPQNYPLGNYGTATVAVCGGTVLPYSQHCQDGPQLVREDEDIKNMADGREKDEEMMRKIYYYTETGNEDAAFNLLEDIDSYLTKRLLLPQYLKDSVFEQAQNLLNALPDSREEEQQFKELYQIYKELYETGNTVWSLTPEQENTVRSIAATYTKTSFDARNLLLLLYGEEYVIQLPLLPEEAAMEEHLQSIAIQFKASEQTTPLGYTVKVYPNPAKDQLFFQLPFTPDKSPFNLELLDYTGKIVNSFKTEAGKTFVLDLPALSGGIYFYRLYQNGAALANGKFVVTH